MTDSEFREALEALHWTQRGFAQILGGDDRLVRRWASGVMPVPESLAAWLEALRAAHDALPVPTDWRLRQRRAREPQDADR